MGAALGRCVWQAGLAGGVESASGPGGHLSRGLAQAHSIRGASWHPVNRAAWCREVPEAWRKWQETGTQAELRRGDRAQGHGGGRGVGAGRRRLRCCLPSGARTVVAAGPRARNCLLPWPQEAAGAPPLSRCPRLQPDSGLRPHGAGAAAARWAGAPPSVRLWRGGAAGGPGLGVGVETRRFAPRWRRLQPCQGHRVGDERHPPIAELPEILMGMSRGGGGGEADPIP